MFNNSIINKPYETLHLTLQVTRLNTRHKIYDDGFTAMSFKYTKRQGVKSIQYHVEHGDKNKCN